MNRMIMSILNSFMREVKEIKDIKKQEIDIMQQQLEFDKRRHQDWMEIEREKLERM